MEVIRTGTGYMSDGTPVYIEDWTVDFKGTDVNPYIVAAFPVSTFTMPGKWSPNAGEKFRYAMHFETFAQAKNCVDNLMHGYKKLEDYADHLDRPEYVRCVQEVQQ